MPQIREQIAMVHLPPSKTLKYLFHVRKTTEPLKTQCFQGLFLFGENSPTLIFCFSDAFLSRFYALFSPRILE